MLFFLSLIAAFQQSTTWEIAISFTLIALSLFCFFIFIFTNWNMDYFLWRCLGRYNVWDTFAFEVLTEQTYFINLTILSTSLPNEPQQMCWFENLQKFPPFWIFFFFFQIKNRRKEQQKTRISELYAVCEL